MTIKDFLDNVITTGKAGAQKSYGKREDANGKAMLAGSLEGFEACRGKEPSAILKLLEEEKAKTIGMRAHFGATDQERDEETRNYWHQRCKEAQIEWVANCISAALVNSGMPGIVPVTARGFMHAATILGVRDATAPLGSI